MSHRSAINDFHTILENLKELNDISNQLSKEMDQKIKILRGGAKDCRSCKLDIDKIIQRNKKRRQVEI